MPVNVWRCCYCKEVVSEDVVCCEKCAKEHEVVRNETRIYLGDVTYSRQTVSLGPTGIVLITRGHLGRRAISCGHLPEELQDQIRAFVLKVEQARQ